MSDVLNVLTAIENYLVDLPAKILLKADQIYIVNGLSDVSENLGIVTAGEFRSGNRLDPGKLFSGMRMSYPPMTYGASDWNLVGVNADTLQFGVRASDGKLLAGGGAVILDSTGITATAGLIAGWVINSDHLLSDGTPGIKILSTGAIETSDFVSGILGKGWRISEAGNAEFNNAVIRGELRTTVLSYQEVQAVSGTMGVFQSAGVIMETTGAVPAVASSMNIKVKDPEYGHTALFAVNDVVWIKDGTNATWFTVTTVTDNTTYYTYACKVESGSTGNVYTAGQAIVNFGVAGEGYLLMEAIGTGAPYFSVRTTSAAPWTGSTNPEHVRMGNLDGNWGYSSAIYGSAIGKYATGVGNITIDPTNGVRIRIYDTTIMEFKSTGAFITNVLNMTGANAAIAIGATPPTAKDAGTGLWLSKDGLFSLASNVYQVKIDATDGKLYAGGGNVVIDSDGITLESDNSTASGILKLKTGSQGRVLGQLTGYYGGSPYPSQSVNLSVRDPSDPNISDGSVHLSTSAYYGYSQAIITTDEIHLHGTVADIELGDISTSTRPYPVTVTLQGRSGIARLKRPDNTIIPILPIPPWVSAIKSYSGWYDSYNPLYIPNYTMIDEGSLSRHLSPHVMGHFMEFNTPSAISDYQLFLCTNSTCQYYQNSYGNSLDGLEWVTIIMWFYPVTVGAAQGLFQYGMTTSNCLAYITTSNKVVFDIIDSTPTTGQIISSNSIIQNTWNYVIFRYQRTGASYINLNGTVTSVSHGLGYLRAASGNFRLGYGNGSYLDGALGWYAVTGYQSSKTIDSLIDMSKPWHGG